MAARATPKHVCAAGQLHAANAGGDRKCRRVAAKAERAREFEEGEIVWSARHHCTARVQFEYTLEHTRKMPGLVELDYEKKYGGKCYNIWIMQELIDDSSGHWMDLEGQRNGFFAAAIAYDLGRLTHLEQYGIDLGRI